MLLPPPRRLCFLIVCLSVSLSVSNFAQKLLSGFAWSLQGRLPVGHWTNDWILVAIWIVGYVATLVKCALAGVYTVPVHLVNFVVLQRLYSNVSKWLQMLYDCKSYLLEAGAAVTQWLKLVSWSLTSLFSTNMAISETTAIKVMDCLPNEWDLH